MTAFIFKLYLCVKLLLCHYGQLIFRTCLLLIKEDYEKIQEELDLIFAMKLLSELNINILPIQGIFLINILLFKDLIMTIIILYLKFCLKCGKPRKE